MGRTRTIDCVTVGSLQSFRGPAVIEMVGSGMKDVGKQRLSPSRTTRSAE